MRYGACVTLFYTRCSSTTTFLHTFYITFFPFVAVLDLAFDSIYIYSSHLHHGLPHICLVYGVTLLLVVTFTHPLCPRLLRSRRYCQLPLPPPRLITFITVRYLPAPCRIYVGSSSRALRSHTPSSTAADVFAVRSGWLFVCGVYRCRLPPRAHLPHPRCHTVYCRGRFDSYFTRTFFFLPFVVPLLLCRAHRCTFVPGSPLRLLRLRWLIY